MITFLDFSRSMQMLKGGILGVLEWGYIKSVGFFVKSKRVAVAVEDALETLAVAFAYHLAANVDVGGHLEVQAAVGVAVFHVVGQCVPVFN